MRINKPHSKIRRNWLVWTRLARPPPRPLSSSLICRDCVIAYSKVQEHCLDTVRARQKDFLKRGSRLQTLIVCVPGRQDLIWFLLSLISVSCCHISTYCVHGTNNRLTRGHFSYLRIVEMQSAEENQGSQRSMKEEYALLVIDTLFFKHKRWMGTAFALLLDLLRTVLQYSDSSDSYG
jgi:hypothetical protein